jgi:hypothetical protein
MKRAISHNGSPRQRISKDCEFPPSVAAWSGGALRERLQPNSAKWTTTDLEWRQDIRNFGVIFAGVDLTLR